jgi:hypothetical protein
LYNRRYNMLSGRKIACGIRGAEGSSRSMSGHAVRGPANLGRGFVAIFVAAAFVWALALSVLPQLHERIHSDANQSNHECAITLIVAGNYHHAAAVPLLEAAAPVLQFGEVAALTPTWVPSPFLGARIFEHAPPVFV